ncbi:methyltransferase domain-containing protein [Shewanella salipaludis]|uniref:Methyltransferase domain-containing protein n=1 Tax=Shewanella salipaludis TaxID=2723052 RepID=A0A972JHS0_9GAMM|nr:methyltransferase domain-containing protein [Shewanella salipaludis]NMH64283.1 methyltransferase domain-containing protein [Shewanella salipaludis]
MKRETYSRDTGSQDTCSQDTCPQNTCPQNRGATDGGLVQVGARFSAAARRYKQHDVLQRLSARSLLSHFSPKGRLLDIGAGPGTDFPGSAQVFALDIAQGMLETLALSYPDYIAVAGDAQRLPFQDASFDCLYSNLALQWCADFPQAVAEAARVLRPDGEFHLSLVAQDSLFELSQLGLAVNGFRSLPALRGAFERAPGSGPCTDSGTGCGSGNGTGSDSGPGSERARWQVLSAELVPMTVYFPDLRSLLYSIKGVGASIHVTPTPQGTAENINSQARLPASPAGSTATGTAKGLRGRRDWLRLVAAAEALRTPQGLPLTYHIAQIRARRLEP